MNIYIPVGSTTQLQRFVDNGLPNLSGHRVIIIYEKGGESKRDAIYKNKTFVLGLALEKETEPFIMMDSDIIYHHGIPEMQAFLRDNPAFAAVALYPFEDKVPHGEDQHVSSSFIMIRNGIDLAPFEQPEKRCWCHILATRIRESGHRVRYIAGKIEHP